MIFQLLNALGIELHLARVYPGSMITSEQLADRMKIEILADMRAGIVPRSVETFSELHDFVDANCYGGTEALLDELDAAGTTEEEHTNALNTLCDLTNPAIEIVNQWLATGAAFRETSQEEASTRSAVADHTTIPIITDQVANAANMAAIDRIVVAGRYRHIVAWGKWLGFTPQAVVKSVELAEADDAPEDSIQKINGQWLRVDDIVNQSNRDRVHELARNSYQETIRR